MFVLGRAALVLGIDHVYISIGQGGDVVTARGGRNMDGMGNTRFEMRFMS